MGVWDFLILLIFLCLCLLYLCLLTTVDNRHLLVRKYLPNSIFDTFPIRKWTNISSLGMMHGSHAVIYLHGCSLRFETYFSNFLRKINSAPYFPCVPLSTSKKYACRLFSTANFDLDCVHRNDEWIRSNITSEKYQVTLSFYWWWMMMMDYRGELILWHGTSRLCPNSSWFRSTMPHGAIPMLTTRPERCCPSRRSASPTCFVTPA